MGIQLIAKKDQARPILRATALRIGLAFPWISFNTQRQKRNRRHSADVIFKCTFLNANELISIKILLKCIPKDPINSIPALVQIMAWNRLGDKPINWTDGGQFTDAYMCHSASMI